MAKLIVAITGTPGTGKSTFAKQLAGKLASCKIMEINDVAKKYKAYLPGKIFDSQLVDTKKLSAAIGEELEKTNKRVVLVVGHLVPDLDIRLDMIVVLREALRVLTKRMKARKYSKEKIKENLISEAVDYCGTNSRKKCKETYEVDNLKDRKEMIAYISRVSMGKKAKEPEKKETGRLNELLDLIEKENEFKF